MISGQIGALLDVAQVTDANLTHPIGLFVPLVVTPKYE